MLEQLVITNFAIIEKVDLQFSAGMTVLTGETGAGKSIIIDALALLTGGRARAELVRHGTSKAVLQAVFAVQEASHPHLAMVLATAGIPCDDGSLILYREINQTGRSVIRVNGIIVPLKTLATIGRHLVDIQGQNDMQQLLRAEEHLGLLDYYAGSRVAELKQDYQTDFAVFRELTQQLASLKTTQQDIAQRLDLLTFQRDEIAAANLQSDEETTLTQERSRLSNFKKIADRLQIADNLLSNDGQNALDALGDARQALLDIASYDAAYAELAETLGEAYYTAQDVSRDVSDQVADLSYDEQELVRIDDRLQQIHDLERKYGPTVPDVLAHHARVTAELDQLDSGALDSDALNKRRDHYREKLQTKALTLHVARQAAAHQLEKDVNAQLADLLMAGAKFAVRLTPITGFTSQGNDHVSFDVQTNTGEGMAPLVKIASGGETARLMLALKTTFAKQQALTAIVFDEADTGVSGRVAQAMARKMRTIAENSQVLAITHLPQVAAVAQHHLLISKQTQADRTTTTVQPVADDQRTAAIAMMLSGDHITATALANARDLLADS